jgi:hypothetical protein
MKPPETGIQSENIADINMLFVLMADCRILGHVTDRQCTIIFGSFLCLKQQLDDC